MSKIRTTNVICGIYKIVNPLGEVYIGASINIKARWYKHKSIKEVRYNNIYKSIVKFGSHNHSFEVVEECSLEEMNCRERYWQLHYNSVQKGLNQTLTGCGDVKPKFCDQTLSKMSKAKKGIPLTEEHKLNISKNHVSKQPDYTHPLLGTTHNHSGHGKLDKPVLQYTKEGCFVQEYKSNRCLERKFKTSGTISKCCNGITKTAFGFIWRYKVGDEIPLKIKPTYNFKITISNTLTFEKEIFYSIILRTPTSLGVG